MSNHIQMTDLNNNMEYQSTSVFLHLDQSVIKLHKNFNTISFYKLFSQSECDISPLHLSTKDSLISFQ